MYCLTDEQVDYILDDIRRHGIELEDLQYNLLDHICCIIEHNLREGDDFEQCYRQTLTLFYKRELRELEEETINLITFKNYYGMKKIMFASGAATTITFVTGSFFKLMHWPGAGAILGLAFILFSLVFLPLVFLLKTKEVRATQDKLMLGVGTLIGICYCISILFMVMCWPGARIMWLGTLAVAFFILLPLYFFNGIRRAETKVNTIITSVIISGILGMQFTITALRKPSQDTSTPIQHTAPVKP